MFDLPASIVATEADNAALRVYLLGTVDFERALALQRLLVYQIAGARDTGALVLCEFAPLVTIGREGSPAQLRCDREELQARHWPVRWVNRGGGCVLHLPGQLVACSIVALDRLGLGLEAYRERLHRVVLAVLADFGIQGQTRSGRAGVWVGNRPIASVGVAVRDWVAYYGLTLNIHPDLVCCRILRPGDDEEGPTSIERERRGPLRPALVRERFIEHFAELFPFTRTTMFFDHPSLGRAATSRRALAPT